LRHRELNFKNMNAAIGGTGWGFIGASTIAGDHMVGAVRAQPGHEVVAIASSQLARAQGFAKTHAVASAYDSVAALLADPRVQVVYISSTNELHRDQVLAAAAAGKHVLCEKPLALTLDDALVMVRACRDARVLMATNHHLRNAPPHSRTGALGCHWQALVCARLPRGAFAAALARLAHRQA
jgi:1,5-anhydro-D-fructose reductase (1,5-anhydro-D-mannitol-forming)